VDRTGTVSIQNIVRGVREEGAAGKVHFLTNNLPYALRLEYGWSKQAPHGMVGVTVKEYQQIVDKAVKES
jgi:hypothetical protein